jgi:hypothetical protein
MKIVCLFSHFLPSCPLLRSSCFFYSIRTNLAFVLRKMEDLDWIMLELEEERKLAIIIILQWLMGHGWGSHGGKWKMSGWGWNIAPKMLHVSAGYVSGAWVARASKCVLGRLSKLNMFQWMVSFKVLVSRLVVFDQWKWMSSCHRNMTCFHVSLLWSFHCSCMKIRIESPQSERCIYDLLLK